MLHALKPPEDYCCPVCGVVSSVPAHKLKLGSWVFCSSCLAFARVAEASSPASAA